MSVRTRASGTVLAAKAFGGNEPPGMAQAAAEVSQMTMDHPFAPGEPVGPYDGYGRHTRQFDFTTGYNIATRPRTHERVSFDTLRGLIDAYDFAQICIWHRIDSLRSLDWKLVAADWYSGDVSDAIAIGMAALKKPDRIRSFEAWFGAWMFDVLAYDAGCLQRLRNRAGRCIGLGIVDGTTIAPLLDYWGNPPGAQSDPSEPLPEAYVQYVNGLPYNWLTLADLVYEPFRPRSNSPYGHAPLETILLNANTDIRFQLYFLQRFTSGNIPEAFASAPEGWDPTQIEKFQAFWDSIMYGDQSRKSQIRWMPGGAKIEWSNEKDFTDAFSLFLMRKTGAAYHVVPSDMGFTETVNLASSESQADVGHRVGDLPLGHYAERILTNFLQDDLRLPLQHQFDWGEEQDDRVAQAQADQIYIEHAVVGASEIRQMRFGLAEPEGQTVPRIFFTAREGPIPLNALMGVAGKIDSATGAPAPGVPLPHEVFTTVQGVIPDPPLTATPLAAEEYGPKAIPPAPPMQPQAEPKATDAAHQVAKEGETAGVTSGTGVYGYDGPGDDEDEDDDEREAAVAKELAAFRRFSRSRHRAGTWRDFRFGRVDAGTARALNAEGQQAVAKAVSAGSGRDPKAWPGWTLDGPVTAYWAAQMAAAATAALPKQRLAELAASWLASDPPTGGSKRDRDQAAAGWLADQGVTIDLSAIAAGMLADAFAAGAVSAAALVNGTSPASSAPGDTSAADDLAAGLGLGDSLGSVVGAAGGAAASMQAGYLGALGKALTDGQDAGMAAPAIAASMSDVVSDQDRAASLAADQVTAASGQAAQAYYGTAEVGEVVWLTESVNPCPVCQANADEGPVPTGTPFSSGDTSAPIHPNCACAVVPA